MTKSETISKFNLYIDDTSELSSTEESDLYDKIYNKIFTARPWEFAKKQFTGSTDGTSYVSLPSDFAYLVANNNHTESSYESERPVVFVGSNYDIYKVVSWSDRRQYRNKSNYCWIDLANSRLEFSVSPASGQNVEFDYVFVPTPLTSGQSPLVSHIISDMIYHGMCVDSFIIQQSQKAKSYQEENQNYYNDYFRDLAYHNSNLIQM
jgi:hypothetical protein